MESTVKAQWTDLADTIRQLGIDILAGAPVTVTEKRFGEPKVLAIMLMSRTLSNFRGVFALPAPVMRCWALVPASIKSWVELLPVAD